MSQTVEVQVAGAWITVPTSSLVLNPYSGEAEFRLLRMTSPWANDYWLCPAEAWRWPAS